jgi:hypothetical protein
MPVFRALDQRVAVVFPWRQEWERIVGKGHTDIENQDFDVFYVNRAALDLCNYYIIALEGNDLFRLLKEKYFLLCNGWSIQFSVFSGTGLHRLIIRPPVGPFFCHLVRNEYGT